MYTITRPSTLLHRLPRKPKKALRAMQHGGGTPRQQKIARAFLRKGLRITTPYVGFNEANQWLVVSERYGPGYPPVSQTLQTLMTELQSYGYELSASYTDTYGRVDSYVFHLPPMTKCSKGHYTAYKKVTHWQAQCERCNEELWTSTVQHDRVILWQGQEYAANDETTVPVPAIIEIFHNFNADHPQPPIPPKGRRRRRYMKAWKRWNDIQWKNYYAQVERWHPMPPTDPQ